MKSIQHKTMILLQWAIVAILLLSAAGCVQAPTPTPTEVPAPTALPTETPTAVPTEVPPTNTPEPTATPQPTPTPPFAIMPEGNVSWCMPIDGLGIPTPVAAPSSVMPPEGHSGEHKDDLLRLLTPAKTCTFVFAFNQPMPSLLKLLVYSEGNPKPWLTTELAPSAEDPNAAVATLKHSQIVNPDAWEVFYTFVVAGEDGTEYFKQKVDVYKILPPRCWDNSLPDPVTLFCPINDR